VKPLALVRHARAALAVAAAGALSAGCGASPGGPRYAELGVTSSSGGVTLASRCFPLPVLPGGTVNADLTLAPALSAHVFLVRDYAEVSLEGTNDPYSSHVELPLETLLSGYVQALDVTALDGKSYVVTLASPCAAPE
jgi:hypothetical protein